MNRTIKKLITRPRIILLVLFIIFAVVSINPSFSDQGVAIRSVSANSSASLAGIPSPSPVTPPRSREVILSVDNVPVTSASHFSTLVSDRAVNSSIYIRTDKGGYSIFVEETRPLGLSVYDAPGSNIRRGLDLEGGTRVLLQPQEQLTPEDLDILIESMKERLNVYGLSDLIVRSANDLPPPLGTGNQYIVVEIAGATEDEVQTLLAEQGKFEAKIGNQTAFTGGDDIRSVCRSAECSGIDPQYGCQQSGSAWLCQFRFSITLSQEAAERQAQATNSLTVVTNETTGGTYLSEPLRLFLDGSQVDQLNIAPDLRGRAVTDIQISGSGTAGTQQAAVTDAFANMKKLQTLLITGSLPVTIDIVKVDTISPLLGDEFIKNSFFIGLVAFIAVALVIFIRYRNIVVPASMLFTMACELTILLGVAALIGWNLDLAAIAGIIIAVGTGVDDQIVITDETIRGESSSGNWKQKLKRALFIIMAAYFTTVVAMIPLVFAGAGLLKGFAITTIIGVSVGVFITRPAYAALIEILLKDKE